MSTFFWAIGLAVLSASAAVPAPEKLLPDDTLVMVTLPDFARARDIFQKSPQSALWNDPAMRPFREKFVARWKEEFVKPLERELEVKFDDYANLPQGQVTFALTQNGWQGNEDQSLGMLVLLDAKGKSGQLKTNLAELRKKWVDAGKTIRTEKIRNFEFSVLPTSSNDVPKTLRKFFPQRLPVQELGPDGEAKKTVDKSELVIGQADSLLIIGNSTKAVEKIVAGLSGGGAPTLGEQAAYAANHLALFRDSPFYGWVNMKTLIELFARKSGEKKESAAADPFATFNADKLLAATGLASLKTIAFNYQNSNEGSLFQIFVGAPESGRTGIFKLLAGEAKEYNPPPFVPADAVKFQRWRLDGQKAWATLEKMLSEISPQLNLNLLLDAATATAKDKDPSFDPKKNLLGNLGDDMISYERAGRESGPAKSPPSLFLLGAKNPEQLAVALKSILGFLSPPVEEREFLGRKIMSVSMPALPLPINGGKPMAPQKLSYAASAGYVAMSTEPSMLEEYLRSSERQGKTLRETPGLVEAAQKVGGAGTALFGYENQTETMRAQFESLRKDSGSATNAGALNLVPAIMGMAGPEKGFKDLMDFSLLPNFDRVAKYFHFMVYAGGANVDGLTLKVFAPVPPGLKAGK